MSEQIPELSPLPVVEDRYFQTQVERIGNLFGLSGLTINIKSGEGWSCGVDKDRIAINVDPLQLAREQHATPAGEAVELDKRHILHTTVHELGHAIDILDKAPLPVPRTSSDAFFWNIVHDTAIDSRSRNVPLLNQVTDSIYKEVLFPVEEQTNLPQHVQFMHKVMLDTVTPNLHYDFSDDVSRAVETLKNHPVPGNRTVNILEALTDLRTPLRSRTALANRYLLPIYRQFEQKDQQEQQDKDEQEGQSQEENQSAGGGNFDEHYEAYEEKKHGSQHSEDQETGNGTSNDTDNSDEAGQQDSDSQSENTGDNEKAGSSGQEQDQQKDSEDGNTDTGLDGADRIQAMVQMLEEVAMGIHTGQQSESSEALADSSQIENSDAESLSNLAGSIRAELGLNENESSQYAEVLVKYRHAIQQTADVLLQLAAPTDSINAPRFQPRAAQEGRRLHPNRLVDASMQAVTRQPRSVWQPIARIATRPEVHFGGLDIHLIVDVSGSMQGSKAKHAASTAIILLEAIDLARYTAQRDSQNFRSPDVRTQVIAFGSSHQTLANLKFETTNKEKATTFHNLRNPNSGSTYVSGALEQVAKATKEFPARDQIAIIVTDGGFYDYSDARTIVRKLPENSEITQLNIGFDPQEQAITPNSKVLTQPKDLPVHLFAALQSYIEQNRTF